MVDPIVCASARDGFALVSLAARRDAGAAAASRMQQQLGLELPPPGRWTASGDLVAICTTPGQWLVMQDHNDFTLCDRLSAVVLESATVIELSDSRVAIQMSGTGVRTALGTFLPLDLHPRAMQPGAVAATVAAHLPVLVRQIDDVPTYELLCARSFAGSFYRALELAGVAV